MLFPLVLWEGLLGGAAYVNTFYRISTEVAREEKEFSLGIVSLADSAGITLAGLLALPRRGSRQGGSLADVGLGKARQQVN